MTNRLFKDLASLVFVQFGTLFAVCGADVFIVRIAGVVVTKAGREIG